MTRARVAVSTLFFVNGAVLASWVAHIPAVKARLTSGDGQLGLVLLAMAGGAVVALPTAGWLIGWRGSRAVSAVSAIALCLAMPLSVLSPTLPALVVMLVVLGASNGLLDVSMNTQAALVEQRMGRPIMSSFHALFSAGGVAGALLASGAMSLGLGSPAHVGAAALAGVVAVAMALPRLIPTPAQPRVTNPTLARPTRSLLMLGVLALLGLLAEGAMGDWSAVYLHDTVGTSPAVAAMGFAAFSLAMAGGRITGDAVVGRFGARRVLRFSGAIAAVGLGSALIVGSAPTGVVGCTLMGLGIANIIPVLFSAAARVPGIDAGRALSAVATTGYLGFLAGPPLIGAVAELLGLTLGLAVVCAACAFVAVKAGALPDA